MILKNSKILFILNLSFLLVVSIGLNSGCATSAGANTKKGAGIGALVGAGVGALIGSKSGKTGEGALMGAAVGGLFGTVAGNRMDKQAEELAAIAETRRTDNGIVTKLQGDILFASGKYELKQDAVMSISQIGEIIRKYPEDRLRVVGHTDTDGSNELNAKLSQQRADSVKSLLIRSGVPSDYIQTVGMGESQPVASNKTADGKQLNRRVEIEITVDESAIPKKK